MNVYKQEILDGLGEKVETSASIALEAEILVDTHYEHPSQEDIQKTLAEYGHSNPDQIDLHYLNSVLVSTGWNKNDDVFDASEAWAAKDTPVDKQFNYMHNESDIIGHITGSMVIDKNGVKIESEEQPEEFDILTSAVLYKSWSDPELSERMSQLIAEIDEGKWAVSMECLFSNFDYSVVSPNGDTKVVARNESSAFLTKHLRVYGGKGEYEGYKVGRLLRNIAFSGKGLVNKPANPRSVILNSNDDPFEEDNTESVTIKEFLMSEAKKVESSEIELEAVVASVNDELEAIKAEKDGNISDLCQTIAEQDASIADLTEKQKVLSKELETVKTEFVDTVAKLTESEALVRRMVRTSQAKDAGIPEDKIQDTLEKFDAIDDEAFAAMLDLVKSHVSLETPSVAPEVAPEPAPEPEPEVVAEEEVAEEEIEEAEVEDTEAALVETVDDAVADSFTTAAEFFRTSVLKTTKNLK